jgi:amidase
MFGNGIEFAVTRTVRDCAALLDAVSGNAPGEKFSAPPPERPYADELELPHQPLRIAVCTDRWSGREIDPGVLAVVEDTAQALRELGHTVEYASPEVSWEALLEAFTTTWCAGTASTVATLAEAVGCEPDHEHFEATTLVCAEAGMRVSAVDLGRAFDAVNTASRAVAEFMGGWDLFLTPTAITSAQELGGLDSDNTTDSAADWVRNVLSDFPFCSLYNQTGAPAINVPVGQSAEGLPIGVQLGADLYRESTLLRAAAQLENARPWRHRLPRVHVGTLAISPWNGTP